VAQSQKCKTAKTKGSAFKSIFNEQRCHLKFSGKLYKRTHRGCRSGARVKYNRAKFRHSVPKVIFSNVQSLPNKLDCLRLNCTSLFEYRESDIMCFCETWLDANTPDEFLEIENFTLFRGDRTTNSGKTKGGGLILYVHNNFCENTHIIDKICVPDIEMLILNMRPFFLPREFTNIFFVALYIPPGIRGGNVNNLVEDEIAKLLTAKPNSIIIIAGDVNKYQLHSALPSFTQYVNAPTRQDSFLDHFYCNVKNAYSCKTINAIGNSDHLAICMKPTYIRKRLQERPTKKISKFITADGLVCLDSLLSETDWNVFIEANTGNINDLTDSITSYIKFCYDQCSTSKTITSFKNHKPWYSSELRRINQTVKNSFGQPEYYQNRAIYRKTLKRAKRNFKLKIEDRFSTNNSKVAWQGLKDIMNLKSSKSSSFLSQGNALEELVKFYSRFDNNENSAAVLNHKSEKSVNCSSPDFIPFEVSEVDEVLMKLNVKKSFGPDGISAKVLKNCHASVAPILCHLFNLSLESGTIPSIWKTSNIVPLPKKRNSSQLKDFRPVALTCIAFKCMERLVHKRLLKHVEEELDPLQFAYKKHSSTTDAMSTLLHFVTSHCDQEPSNTSRCLFLDFSSAFNTIPPVRLIMKLKNQFLVPNYLCNWTFDFLTERQQYVSIQGRVSRTLTTNIGSPQGCILSPLLFSLYTNDLQTDQPGISIIKYADDTLILGNLRKDASEHYRMAVNTCIKWCSENKLVLNETKTKELVFDFRRNKASQDSLYINGTSVEMVQSFKYLGCTIDDKLLFIEQANHVLKKAAQRRFLVYQLYTFNVNKCTISLAYSALVRSTIQYCISAYFHTLGKKHQKRLSKLFAKCPTSKFVPLNEFVTKQMKKLSQKIINTSHHPLNKYFSFLPSRRRLNVPFCRTSRYQKTFVPHSVMLLNS